MLKAPRGTKDVLPEEVAKWRKLEETARKVFEANGYGEIRTPIFELTGLFVRSIGETTDIVEKEMYTLSKAEDKESITLRPEATAPVVRAYIEHNLFKAKAFRKFYYIGPMFRYERPQAGRQRQFHQLGVEALGSADPLLDAEMILMIEDILRRVGAGATQVRINSCGCPACRPAYRAILREEFSKTHEALCPDCRRRYERNVFRILDCKNPGCRQLARNLPGILDHVCADCRDHFEAVKRALARVGASSAVDGLLVRGLDYYTRTVFEVTSEALGAQNAVAAGGRYDGLVSEFGGPDTPAVGFAMGMERAILLMTDGEGGATTTDLYVATTDRELHESAWILATGFRRAGLSCEIDHEGRSLKAQMREANRLGVRHVAIVGPDEMKAGVVTLRDMGTKEERRVSVEEAVRAIRGETP